MPQGQQQNVAHIPSVKSSLSYRPVSNSRDSLIVRQMGSLRDQETSEINANVGDIHGTLVQDLPGLNIRRLASSSERNQSLNLPHHDVRTIDPAEQKLWETQPDEIARQPCEVYFKDNYPGFADARQGGGSSSNISAGYHTIDLSQMTRRQTQESISIKHSRNDTHALQDYQMQLMLLEQQNRKRAMIARQAQSNLSSDIEPPVPVDHINLSPISFRRSTSSHGPPTGLPYTSFSTVPKYQFHMSTASTQQMSQGEHAPLLENPSIDDVSLGLNDNTQQQETDISHEQLNSIYHYDRYAEVSGHMSVDDAEDADVLKSFDFESFLQDKEDDKGLDTKLETAPLSAPDHSLLLSLSPSTLNERKGSFASLAVERDSGSGRSDKQGERYHFTQPMREYGDEDPLRVAMNDFFGADHQSRSRGTPEKFGDEAFQHELASPDQGKGSTEVFGSPMESIAKGRPEGDDFEEVVGTITNWDQTADSQRPDLGLGRSLQNVVPRLESPKHGGYASRGKRKYRKRRKKTQGMDSVISSKQQVQNEEGSISRLSQELQCRGIQMENSCIVDDGRRVHRQTRSKTDTSPNVENNNNDSLVEVSEGTVLAAETPMIPAEGMKRPLGLPQPSGTVRTDAKYLRGNEEVMFGASQESRSSGIYETQANAGIGDGDIKNALVKEGSRLGQDVAIPRSREHFAPPPLAPPKQLCCIGKIQIPSRKPRTTGDCGIPEGASLNSSIWRRSRSTSPLTRTKPKTSRTPIKEMQGLVATDAERSRAQEEILKLLRQWTTCDSSIWTDERTQATQNA
ncbi:hypothetical protein MMC11_005526 [Xylographa trunciseda]|nr:hypothetical protein [Xylographa trunciseda]